MISSENGDRTHRTSSHTKSTKKTTISRKNGGAGRFDIIKFSARSILLTVSSSATNSSQKTMRSPCTTLSFRRIQPTKKTTRNEPFFYAVYACGKNMKYARKMTSIPYMIGWISFVFPFAIIMSG